MQTMMDRLIDIICCLSKKSDTNTVVPVSSYYGMRRIANWLKQQPARVITDVLAKDDLHQAEVAPVWGARGGHGHPDI